MTADVARTGNLIKAAVLGEIVLSDGSISLPLVPNPLPLEESGHRSAQHPVIDWGESDFGANGPGT